MSKITLLGRPSVEKLASGLRRITRRWKVDPSASIAATIEAETFLAFGTPDIEFEDAVLVAQRIDPREESGVTHTLVREYQELADSALTATTEVAESTLFDGRRVTRTTYLCKASQAASLRPEIGSGSPAVFQVDVEENGPVARVITSAIEITDSGFVYSQSDDTRNNGALLLRTIRTLAAVAATPSGYTAIGTSTQQQDGYTIYSATFAKGEGQISQDDDTKNNGKLSLRTIRHLTAPATANPISTPADYTLVGESYAEQDGYRVWTAQYAKGAGRISTGTDTKNGGKLVLTTVRYLGEDDGTTPDGVLVSTETAEQDGYTVTTETYAAGSGEISRETDTRLSGQLLRTTIRHLTALDVGSQPTSDPNTSGSTITSEGRSDQDGYRVWTVTWTKALSTSFIVNSTTKRNNGKLVIYRREQFGSAPTAPSATIGGTVVETDASTRLEDGFTVYVKEWAEGVGTVTDDVQLRYQGKLRIYHKVALAAAPSDPSAAIGGTVTLIADDSREESGVTIYDRTWAEGAGVISERRQSRDGFLRIVHREILGAESDADANTPVGILLEKDWQELEGVRLWSVTVMQSSAGGNPLAGGVGHLVLTNGGTGYTSMPTVSITGGGGTGATASVVLSGGVDTGITLTNAGSGYTSAPTVSFVGGGGSGATATASVIGDLASISIVSGGTSYANRPTISITGGGGSGATASAKMKGPIQGYVLNSGGSGYTDGDFTLVYTGSGGNGSFFQGTARIRGGTVVGLQSEISTSGDPARYLETSPPVVSLPAGAGAGTGFSCTPLIGNGSVSKINVSAGGSGYVSAPTVSFTGGGGSGAAAVAILSGDAVQYVVLTNSGSGYTSLPTVSFTGGSGTGATATSQIQGRDAQVESVVVDNAGSGYTSAPTVSFTSTFGGGGASANAVMDFEVTSVTLAESGSGYTSAPTVSFTGGGGSGAAATADLLTDTIASVALTAAGSGYTSEPTVSITGGGGSGAEIAALLAPVFSYDDYVEFTYPGRAKVYYLDVESSVPGRAYDVFLSAPVDILLRAAIEVSYTTDADGLAVLPYDLWNPTASATIFATWVAQSDTAPPRSKVQALRGYRSIEDTAVTVTAGSGAADRSIFGDPLQPSTVGSIQVSGGPETPDGNTYVLGKPLLQPAFVGYDGTQYYRRVLVIATIPAQDALPV